MGYTVADMFNLFQFSEGLTGLDVCRLTGIKRPQMQFAKAEDVLTKKTNELMVRQSVKIGTALKILESIKKRRISSRTLTANV